MNQQQHVPLGMDTVGQKRRIMCDYLGRYTISRPQSFLGANIFSLTANNIGTSFHTIVHSDTLRT